MPDNLERPIDDKYISFKRADFEEILHMVPERCHSHFSSIELRDSIVFRLQDQFTGPVLHAYVSALSTSIELLSTHGVQKHAVQELERIRDHFSVLATMADEFQAKKLPD